LRLPEIIFKKLWSSVALLQDIKGELNRHLVFILTRDILNTTDSLRSYTGRIHSYTGRIH